MEIRELDILNINEIVELVWKVQTDFNQIPIVFRNEESKVQFKQFVLKRMINELKFLGAFIDNKLVGVIGYEENYIMFLYVLKEFQRKGVGTKLIRIVLELLKGYETIMIDSIEESKDFYKKIGFIDKDNKVYSICMEYKRK